MTSVEQVIGLYEFWWKFFVILLWKRVVTILSKLVCNFFKSFLKFDLQIPIHRGSKANLLTSS